VRTTYRCWQSAYPYERRLAFAAYRYALEDEEVAATTYARLAAMAEGLTDTEMLGELGDIPAAQTT